VEEGWKGEKGKEGAWVGASMHFFFPVYALIIRRAVKVKKGKGKGTV